MNKWKIDITLKGSCVVKHCVYRGPEQEASEVIEKLFSGKDAFYYVDLYGEDGKSMSYVCVGEIAAIDICKGRS